jgi:hypothetical protein
MRSSLGCRLLYLNDSLVQLLVSLLSRLLVVHRFARPNEV